MTRSERSKLDGLEMRTTGRAWQLGTDDHGQQVVIILRGDGSREPMYVKHDDSPPRWVTSSSWRTAARTSNNWYRS